MKVNYWNLIGLNRSEILILLYCEEYNKSLDEINYKDLKMCKQSFYNGIRGLKEKEIVQELDLEKEEQILELQEEQILDKRKKRPIEFELD